MAGYALRRPLRPDLHFHPAPSENLLYLSGDRQQIGLLGVNSGNPTFAPRTKSFSIAAFSRTITFARIGRAGGHRIGGRTRTDSDATRPVNWHRTFTDHSPGGALVGIPRVMRNSPLASVRPRATG